MGDRVGEGGWGGRGREGLVGGRRRVEEGWVFLFFNWNVGYRGWGRGCIVGEDFSVGGEGGVGDRI